MNHLHPRISTWLLMPVLAVATLLAIGGELQAAEEGLAPCTTAFVEDDIGTAPKRTNPTAATEADTTHLCYRVDDKVFFAVEYSARRLTANWVAHRLEDSFGPKGCGSIRRDDTKCYFMGDNLGACLKAKKKPGDPFHEDPELKKLRRPRLTKTAYTGTGHDRGHLAPNQSFSHHVCGAGQTFTMANMSPQFASLNQGLWADLEAQVLFWAVTEGPIYVVTGTTFTTFPADKFTVIKSGTVDKSTLVKPSEKLKEGAGGFVGKIVKPTGFYKVVFRPARNGAPARAVAFLVPHPRETMSAHFRQFVARIDLVEQASGFTFSVPDELKGAGTQAWWLERKLPANWRLRDNDCPENSERAGWQEELSRADRNAACLLP